MILCIWPFHNWSKWRKQHVTDRSKGKGVRITAQVRDCARCGLIKVRFPAKDCKL